MPRSNCEKCGRFAGLKMKSPIYDRDDHKGKLIGWRYSFQCTCGHYNNLKEMLK